MNEIWARLEALWEEFRTDDDGAADVMQQIVAATAAEVQGRLAPREYHARVQAIWAAWLEGDTSEE